MRCEQVWDLLSTYADSEATGDEAAIVETHIAVCSVCARDLDWMKSTTVALTGLGEVEPPVSLHASILAATVYRPTWQQRFQAALGTAFAFRTLRYGALAGSAAMAAWLTVNLSSGPISPNPAAYQPVTKASPANPAPVSTGPSTLFTARLDEGLKLPDLGENAAPMRNLPRPAPRRVETGTRLAAVEAAPALRVIHPLAVDKSLAGNGHLRDSLPGGPIAEEPSAMLDSLPTVPDTITAPRAADLGRAGESGETATANSPMTTAPMHVALASYSEPAPQTQLVTLADLKRSLRRQAMGDRAQFVTESIREKRIRLDVVRGRF